MQTSEVISIFSKEYAEKFNHGKNYSVSLNFPAQEHEANQAASVDLLNKTATTMYGKRIKNPGPANPKGRKQYDIHPYTKQGSGVSCTVAFIDAKTREINVLLAKKKNRQQFDQIGGYTKGQGPEGSEVIVDKRSDDQRDRDEEELIGNKDAVTVTEKKDNIKQVTYTLETLSAASLAGFLAQQKDKIGQRVNPVNMKQMLKSRGIDYADDYNAEETAFRELGEETQLFFLNPDLSQNRPIELYTSDDYGVTNDPRLHTKVTHYLFYLGKLEKAPAVKAGSDIELLKWVALSDIQLLPGFTEAQVKNDLTLRMCYAIQTLPRAIKMVRYKELRACSNNLFSKHKNVENHLRFCLTKTNEKVENILPPVSFSPYSPEAKQYHEAIIITAKYFVDVVGGKHPFDLDQLKERLDSKQLGSSFGMS